MELGSPYEMFVQVHSNRTVRHNSNSFRGLENHLRLDRCELRTEMKEEPCARHKVGPDRGSWPHSFKPLRPTVDQRELGLTARTCLDGQ
jgi:hypothetical protein